MWTSMSDDFPAPLQSPAGLRKFEVFDATASRIFHCLEPLGPLGHLVVSLHPPNGVVRAGRFLSTTVSVV